MSTESSEASGEPERHEVPPRPEEVLDPARIKYQAMSDLSDEDYAILAEDIRDRGVLNPVIVDENNVILDGHHREAIAEHYDLNGSRAPSYLTIGDLDTDEEKLARAIKQNVVGRDTTDGVKREAVVGYIKSAWPRDDDDKILDKFETEEQVAEKLGVGRKTVTRAKDDLSRNGHLANIGHTRHLVREYYDENPDATYREIAEGVDADVGKSTVANWIKEDFGDDDDEDEDTEQQPLNIPSRNRDEAKAAGDLVSSVSDEDTPDEVKETAEKELSKAANREQSPSDAATEVKNAREQAERKERYETDAKAQQQASEDARESWDVSSGDIWELESENADEPHRIVCGDGLDDDVLDALLGDVTPDLAYADPPYGIGDDVNRGQGSTTGFQTSYEFPDIEGDSTIESAVAAHRRFTEMDIPRIVLWGANHYAHELPPSQGWLVWDKRDGIDSDDYADCELAWTNLDNAARVFRHLWRGAIKASEKNERRIHPTQKPIALAEWCIETYCDDVSSVFDPFLGSGSTLLGADACGVPCYGVEMSEDYVAAILERASAHGLEPTRVGVVD